ncbi:chorismate--pyruvate lyase family protein [Veronia pacifica]|uniref:Probable chorismate pyruvate-lyase n=1 Tax=Veronia pacifica TaxID=1080227 RepID=A0A1C3EJ47_9GAMM|nr:chorismate lyase [Veronia pacifica]ODA33262.1 chorismate--pyruvate lyase [Veronia pacifica]
MTEFKSLYLSALRTAQWDCPDWQGLEGTSKGAWLLEPGSMTERLKHFCRELEVRVISLEKYPADTLTETEKHLLNDEDCLVRDVVLIGDGIPWICARTLMPLSTLTDQEEDIAELGAVPLGQRVFTHETARRDALEVTTLDVADGRLHARRSRLWLNEKPMLVCEVFLPHSPVYFTEDVANGSH